MKNSIRLIIILVVLGIFSSCGDSTEPEPTPIPSASLDNKFTLAEVDYNTPHCYFYVSYGAPYKNLFTIYLLNEELYQDTAGAGFYVDNTNYFLSLRNFVSSTPVPSISDVIMNGTFQPSVGGQTAPLLTYNIDDWVVEGSVSGRDVGYPTNPRNNGSSTNSFVYPDQTNPGSYTISNLVMDNSTLTGTMDLTYSVLGDNNELLEGSYSGAFTIISGGT